MAHDLVPARLTLGREPRAKPALGCCRHNHNPRDVIRGGQHNPGHGAPIMATGNGFFFGLSCRPGDLTCNELLTMHAARARLLVRIG